MSKSDETFFPTTHIPTDYVRWIRQRVGSRKIFLVFASVVLRDGQGRILLQRRTDFDFWGIPGGAQELGEDIVSCARRELREETGLEAGALALVGVYSDPAYDVRYPNGDLVQQFSICFAAEVAGGKMRVDGVEARSQRFFDPQALPWAELPPWYRAMLCDALGGGPPAFCPPAALSQTEDQIQVVRTRIGPAPYLGVGATVAVTREDGRVLLARREEDGYWVFPGGFSELGENVAQTAVREVQEETGLVIAPRRILGHPGGDQHDQLGAARRVAVQP